MDLILRRLMRAASNRGFSGGDYAWLALAGSLWWLRRVRRRSSTIESLVLRPGQGLEVSVRWPGDRAAG